MSSATIIRKRSPRAPSISLRDALDRVTKVYEEEGMHPANLDIVAQHLGYKSADNGAAKRTLANLGYYGLLDRPSDGMAAVTKSVQEYKFAPSEDLRTQILRKWLLTPNMFAELLEKFPDRLPSDASLKYELIQKGFTPEAADECLTAFLESVQYVESMSPPLAGEASNGAGDAAGSAVGASPDQSMGDVTHAAPGTRAGAPTLEVITDEESDRIPVRLTGGRRAWLVIPSPFYEAD